MRWFGSRQAFCLLLSLAKGVEKLVETDNSWLKLFVRGSYLIQRIDVLYCEQLLGQYKYLLYDINPIKITLEQHALVNQKS